MVSFGFSKSKSSSSSEPVDVTPQVFQNLQDPFAQVLAQLIGSTASGTTGGATSFAPTGDTGDVVRGIPVAEGPFAAPIGAGEQTILDQLLAQAGGTNTSVSQNLLSQTAQGSFLTENPFLQSQIELAQRTSLQGLEELLTRVLPGRFTQGGQFTQPEGSSAFDRAAAIATRGVAGEVAGIATQLAGQGFEAERQRQQEAAIALPQINETEVNTLISNLQAQALPRLIEQFGLEAGTEAFNQQISALLQVLAIASGTTQPVISTESSSKGSSFGFNAGVASSSGSSGSTS